MPRCSTSAPEFWQLHPFFRLSFPPCTPAPPKCEAGGHTSSLQPGMSWISKSPLLPASPGKHLSHLWISGSANTHSPGLRAGVAGRGALLLPEGWGRGGGAGEGLCNGGSPPRPSHPTSHPAGRRHPEAAVAQSLELGAMPRPAPASFIGRGGDGKGGGRGRAFPGHTQAWGPSPDRVQGWVCKRGMAGGVGVLQSLGPTPRPQRGPGGLL